MDNKPEHPDLRALSPLPSSPSRSTDPDTRTVEDLFLEWGPLPTGLRLPRPERDGTDHDSLPAREAKGGACVVASRDYQGALNARVMDRLALMDRLLAQVPRVALEALADGTATVFLVPDHEREGRP